MINGKVKHQESDHDQLVEVFTGLFHLISIHPLWMTANECPGGYFEACPGSKTLILMKGRGYFDQI